MFTSSTKHEIKQFHVLVVQRQLFRQSNPTAFLTSSLLSSLLKIPNEGGRGGMGALKLPYNSENKPLQI